MQINGIDVRNARHDQVITLLTGAGPNVELEVLRKLTTSNTPNASYISGVFALFCSLKWHTRPCFVAAAYFWLVGRSLYLEFLS